MAAEIFRKQEPLLSNLAAYASEHKSSGPSMLAQGSQPLSSLPLPRSARGSGISCTRSAPIGEATSAPEKDDSLYRLIVTGTRGAS
jgi:hypothetical protein